MSAATDERPLPRLPLDKTLWTKEQVGQHLKVSPRTLERLYRVSGFPKPKMIGHSPRWIAAEVIDWVSEQ